MFKIRSIDKLKKQIKNKSPEEQVKELLDAGMDEKYCEEVYDYLKVKQNGK